MIVSGLAIAIALTASSQSTGVKWVPLNAPKEPVAKTPQSAPAPAPVQPAPSQPVAQPEIPVTTSTPTPEPEANAEPVASAVQGPLQLTCVGAGIASKASAASVWGYGGWGVIAKKHDRGFSDQVDVRLFNGDDRIRMPRTMLPGIHGGDHGWFKLHDVVADARSVRASAGVGLLNNPKVFIDRVTGTISISGKSGDYAGQCQVIDANAPAKF